MFSCTKCDKEFGRADNLKRHIAHSHTATDSDSFLCEICGKLFVNVDSLNRHIRKIHKSDTLNLKRQSDSRNIDEDVVVIKKQNKTPQPSTSKSDECVQKEVESEKKVEETIECTVCSVFVLKKNYSAHKKSLGHKGKVLKKFENDENIQIVESAFVSRIISYRISDGEKFLTVGNFMEKIKAKIIKLIQCAIQTHNAIKVNFSIYGQYEKKMEEGSIEDIKCFKTGNFPLFAGSDLSEMFKNSMKKLTQESEEFQERDSGWAIREILFLEININKYNPLKGSSYIPTPKFWIKKHAIINVKNADNTCFAWAITSALHPTCAHSDRITSYPHHSTIVKMGDVSFPVRLRDITKLEKLNNLSINVYGLEETKLVGPLYFTSNRGKERKHINLLYLEGENQSHYCWIKDLGRLIYSQISLFQHRKWLCDGCLQYFKTEERLIKHSSEDCGKVKCVMPSHFDENVILKFKNIKHKILTPFVIYGDFEAILEPIDSCSPNPNHSFTENMQKHTPASFAYYIKCSYNEKFSKFVQYRGADCGSKFVEYLQIDMKIIYDRLKVDKPMTPLTLDEKKIFRESKTCFLCELEFDYMSIRVRDHCHLDGHFRGAAHRDCNIQLQIPNYVPFVFHNLSGYDSHFIIKEMGFDNEKIELLANNKERYISFTKYFRFRDGDVMEQDQEEEEEEDDADDQTNILKLRFIDSFKFMSSSLEKLAQNLSDDQFNVVRGEFSDKLKFNLIRQKGVFPYEYVTSHDVLNETTSLPPIEKFNSKLNGDISPAEYVRAQNVWKSFNCSTLGDYSDLYLKSDVLILADVFENFRSTCMAAYQLDPAHYYTAPGLSWDSMLKYTKIEMELLTDVDMIHFIKKGIRGGFCQVSKKYSKANNSHMKELYNPSEEDIFIIYLDVNNLYGHSLSQHLPYGNFKWVDIQNNEDIYMELIQVADDDDDKGYIVEVDLEYPENLHDIHSDYPFCAEQRKATKDSKYEKLIAGVNHKNNYIVHYRYLKLCLKYGLKLVKLHRVLEFSQKPFLKPYIDLNTSFRTRAQNNFEKDFYKLMNNSVFGKTIEDVTKRVDVKLVTHWNNIGKKYGANTLIAKPNFHSSTMFSENLVGIQLKRTKIFYNKPIYVGFSVLDFSKEVMYDFYYGRLKPKYGDNCKLLYTDTDSFMIEVRTKCFYSDMRLDVNFLSEFDTSDFDEKNVYDLPRINKKVVGKMKDEMAGKIIVEFIGLKAKSYSFKDMEDVEIKRSKGVKKNVVNNHISVNDYRECLVNNKKIIRQQTVFRSIKHDLYTQNVNKLALDNFDDKRYLIPNSYDTLPWDHYKIVEFK